MSDQKKTSTNTGGRKEYKKRGAWPTCTAKHWILVARALKRAKPVDDPFGLDVWRKIIFEVAAEMAVDNDRFQRGRFFTECGLPPKKKVK